ncbi:MAG: hypothetical protein J7M38_15715 [Armatimonadetes bacterium]|nr:hypothetical protein [Armatimonadota bacterium]
MAITVLTVIILILIAGYAAFFAAWNPAVVDVVTLQYPGGSFMQSTPVWVLPLVGLLVGALVMAIALSGPWSTMRRAAGAARQQLKAERDKSNQRAKKINALNKRIKELEEQTSDASDDGGETAGEGLEQP